MTTPTTKIPTWATSATVPSGGDVGLSSRLEPSGGTLASGHLADTRTAARVENWLKGSLCDWVGALAPITYANWTSWTGRTNTPSPMGAVLPSAYVSGVGGFWTIPLAIEAAPLVGQSDKHPSTLDSTGAHERPGVIVHGTVDGLRPICSAARLSGDLVVTFSDVDATNTSILQVAANSLVGTVVVLHATPRALKVAYSPLAALFVAYPAGVSGWADGETYWTSADGLTWAPHTIASFGTNTASSMVAGARTGQLALGMLGSNQIAFSDDGVTWTITARGGSAYTVGLCETAAGWLALDNASALWRYTGGAWVAAGTLTDGDGPNALGALVMTNPVVWIGNLLASDGGRAVTILTASSGRLYIKLSLDEGETWRDVGISHSYAPGSPAHNWLPGGLSYSDGQFAATAYGPDSAGTGWAGTVFFSMRM
jgi:hypothetical protein